MDWAQRRKILYAAGFLGILAILFAYPLYKMFVKPPTCFDGKKNGVETGVDCGGVCALMCKNDVKQPRVVWARAFPVNGVYDIGVYMENINTNAGLKNAHYTIRVIGANEQVLTEKKGVIELAPSSRVLVFEAGVQLASSPERVEVLFDSADLSHWLKATTAPSAIVTKNQNLKDVDTKPRFDAVIVNTDPVNDIPGLSLGAVIYDSTRNPIAISKTYVDTIQKGGEENIFFTWPNGFPVDPQGFLTEIIITPRAIFSE